jgi:hypothetical protein
MHFFDVHVPKLGMRVIKVLFARAASAARVKSTFITRPASKSRQYFENG